MYTSTAPEDQLYKVIHIKAKESAPEKLNCTDYMWHLFPLSSTVNDPAQLSITTSMKNVKISGHY